MNRHLRADNIAMARFIIALLLFFIGALEAQAYDDWELLTSSPERLIGILDLPDIVQGGCGPAPHRSTTRAFATPTQNGRSVGTIYWYEEPNVVCDLMIEKAGGEKEQVPTLESGYEIPAAIVYERRGSWFRIRLATGSAWIRHDDETDFLPYPEFMRDQLSYVVHTWDGTLRTTPSVSGKVTPLTKGWQEVIARSPGIKFLGSRRVAGELWIQIELTTEERCGRERELEGMTPVSGWIPAYDKNRTPLVWFSSRGC